VHFLGKVAENDGFIPFFVPKNFPKNMVLGNGLCLHALPFSLKRAKQISLIFQEFFREASKFHLLAFLFCASETSSEITTFLAQKRKGCLRIWEAS